MTETNTRLLLRVSVKLMSLLAVALALYTLLASVSTDNGRPHKVPPLLFRTATLPENQAQPLAWGGGNLLLVRRSDATIASLRSTEGLLDPTSSNARQPAGLPTDTRSVRPELFVAFNRGPDSGCPLRWIAPGSPIAPHRPWAGGFRDSCNGSWYDAAGRVFVAQHAGRNLDIPPYRFRGEDLLEIGRNGDNAAPAQ